MSQSINDILALSPVIPVLVIDRVEDAVPLATALVEGGLPVLEITLRTEAGLPAIRAISEQVEGACVGVGTVISTDEMEQSLEAGATFAVSPGLTSDLAKKAAGFDLPYLPGVASPSDVMRALDHGLDVLKLFPAAAVGGIDMLKSLAGPFPGVTFCPTGGIGAGNMTDFLSLPNVVTVGGSWVAPKAEITSGNWAGIRTLAEEAVQKAAGISH